MTDDEWVDITDRVIEIGTHPGPPVHPIDVAEAFDVPPWVIGVGPRPRFARIRWVLRRWIPLPRAGAAPTALPPGP